MPADCRAAGLHVVAHAAFNVARMCTREQECNTLHAHDGAVPQQTCQSASRAPPQGGHAQRSGASRLVDSRTQLHYRLTIRDPTHATVSAHPSRFGLACRLGLYGAHAILLNADAPPQRTKNCKSPNPYADVHGFTHRRRGYARATVRAPPQSAQMTENPFAALSTLAENDPAPAVPSTAVPAHTEARARAAPPPRRDRAATRHASHVGTLNVCDVCCPVQAAGRIAGVADLMRDCNVGVLAV